MFWLAPIFESSITCNITNNSLESLVSIAKFEKWMQVLALLNESQSHIAHVHAIIACIVRETIKMCIGTKSHCKGQEWSFAIRSAVEPQMLLVYHCNYWTCKIILLFKVQQKHCNFQVKLFDQWILKLCNNNIEFEQCKIRN